MSSDHLSPRQFSHGNVTDLTAYRAARQPTRPHPTRMSSADLAQHIQRDHGVYVDDDMAGPLMTEQMHADLHRAIGEHTPMIPHDHDRP